MADQAARTGGFTNITGQMGAGGICSQHGVFEGRGCRACAKTRALAGLRQATWEATQFLSYNEVREWVEAVLREVESDEP